MSTEHAIVQSEMGSRRRYLPCKLFLITFDYIIPEAEQSAVPIGMRFSISSDGRIKIEDDRSARNYRGQGLDHKRRSRQLRLALQTNRRTRGMAERKFRRIETTMEDLARTAVVWVLPGRDSFRSFHTCYGWEPIRLAAHLNDDFTKCLGILNEVTSEMFKEEAAEKLGTMLSLPSLRTVHLELCFKNTLPTHRSSERPHDRGESLPFERSTLRSPTTWGVTTGSTFKSFLDQAEAKGITVLTIRDGMVAQLVCNSDGGGVDMVLRD